MTTLQYILAFVAIVIMVAALFYIVRGSKNRRNTYTSQAITHNKNGIPIIPRHERHLPDEETYLKEYVDGETDHTTAPNQHHRQYDDADDMAHNGYDTRMQSRHDVADNMHHDYANEQERAQGQDWLARQRAQDAQMLVDAGDLGHGSHATMEDSHVTLNEDEDLFSTLASATENLMPPVDIKEPPAFDQNSPVLDEHLLEAADQDQNSPLNHAEENINITLMPYHNYETIHGTTVLSLVEQYGLKYGAMNMFHRYENKDGTGILWFSMMGLTNEGIAPFDLNSLPQSEFKGLILFLSLPHPKALQGFDSMMSIVGLIAKQLNLQVLDEENEPLDRERKQQLRNQVQEYRYSGY